jgi:hypothetical protein
MPMMSTPSSEKTVRSEVVFIHLDHAVERAIALRHRVVRVNLLLNEAAQGRDDQSSGGSQVRRVSKLTCSIN